MEEKVLSFLKTLKPALCVLSTSTPQGKPESAVLAYAVNNDLSIIISSHLNSRKIQNMLQNNQVCIIFGWAFTGLNIQYEGTATVIKEGEELKRVEEAFYAQQEATRKFHSPDSVFAVIKPTWMRVTDLTEHPWKSEEKSFTDTA
jgi:pyridoxine/pyridoxamine 5'-phosphate oxidase